METLFSTRPEPQTQEEIDAEHAMDDLIMDAFSNGANMLHGQSSPENVRVTAFKDGTEPSTQIVAGTSCSFLRALEPGETHGKEPEESGSGPSVWILMAGLAGLAALIAGAWWILS